MIKLFSLFLYILYLVSSPEANNACLIFIDFLIPFDIQGLANCFNLRLDSVFNGACLFTSGCVKFFIERGECFIYIVTIIFHKLVPIDARNIAYKAMSGEAVVQPEGPPSGAPYL